MMIEKLMKMKCLDGVVFKEKEQKFINTNCGVLNILFGGTIDSGIPKGKISMIASDSALGKSQISMNICARAQMDGMSVVIFDSEKAITQDILERFSIDMSRCLLIQSTSLEKITTILMNIEKEVGDEKDNYLIVIDSWNVLVSSKTVEDNTEGKDVVDMTTTKKKNTLAKLLLNAGFTTFVVNQVYSSMSAFQPLDDIPGGKGVYFASSSIVQSISKAKDKNKEGDVTGSVVTAITRKGRFSKENSKLKYRINYNGGIDAYYGILDIAVASGVIIKGNVGRYSLASDQSSTFKENDFYGDIDLIKMVISSNDFKQYVKSTYTYQYKNDGGVFEAAQL